MIGKVKIFAFLSVSIGIAGSALAQSNYFGVPSQEGIKIQSILTDVMSTYTATLFGAQLEDFQEFRNCIQYEFCSITTSSLTKAGNLYKFTIGPFSKTQVDTINNRCPLYRFKADILFRNQYGTITSHKSTALDFSSYYSTRKTQYLDQSSIEGIKKSLGEIDSLILKFDHDGAIQKTLFATGLDTLGYKMIYDPLNDFSGAITNHDKKNVRIGPKTFEGLNACELVRIVRHELEHIHQYAQARFCARSGTPSELDDHNQREISAHLNDILNFSKYCGDAKMQKASLSWSLRSHVNEYIDRL